MTKEMKLSVIARMTEILNKLATLVPAFHATWEAAYKAQTDKTVSDEVFTALENSYCEMRKECSALVKEMDGIVLGSGLPLVSVCLPLVKIEDDLDSLADCRFYVGFAKEEIEEL